MTVCGKAICVALAMLAATVWADEPVLNKTLNESVVFIEKGSGWLSTRLETTIFRPFGDGPFPLVVINHGKEEGNPHFQSRARYIVAARELVKRGYVVMVPMRGGFSRSTGTYVGGGCNVEGNALAQAKDVRAALDYAVKLPFVDPRRIIMMGQSHGGLTTMAFGVEPYPGVLGLVNFAGGLRQTQRIGWEKSLIAAFASFGQKNRLPSLWFYGDNDSFWTKETVNEMHERYVAGGGRARLVSFGIFKKDAHGMFVHSDGRAIWWPEVEKFFVELGLPTEEQPRTVASNPINVRLLEAADSLRLDARCSRVFAAFLDADYPRAFAVSEHTCGYAFGGQDFKKRASEFCRGAGGAACQLFAVDDQLVSGN